MTIDYSTLPKQDSEEINVLKIIFESPSSSPPLFVPWISLLDRPAPSGKTIEDVPLFSSESKIIAISRPELTPIAFERAAPVFSEISNSAPRHQSSTVYLGDFMARLEARAGTDHFYHDFFVAYALADALDAVKIKWPEGSKLHFGKLIGYLSASNALGQYPCSDSELQDVLASIAWAVGALACKSVYLSE